MSNISGIINVIKPPAMSSFQVVSFVRKTLKCKKAGHTGTLDPAAVGVLPVCLGKATKIIPFLPEAEKEYVAEITLGIVTDTLDAEGEVLEENNNWQELTEEKINEIVTSFTGEIEQIPPMFSALHHQGKRLYELAREGKEVEREPRKVEIFKLELLSIKLPCLRLRVSCSRGTYIRSLAADIGNKLGAGAFLSFLVRTRSGPFAIEEGVTLKEIETRKRSVVIPPYLPLDMPHLFVKRSAEKKASNGVKLGISDFMEIPANIANHEQILVFTQDKRFISINEIFKQGDSILSVKPLKVFNLVGDS